MTFPGIPTVANGRLLLANQLNTTATRTFPAFSGLTQNEGDLLIAVIIAYQSSVTPAFSSWSHSFSELHDSGSSSSLAVGIAFKRVGASPETGSLTVTQAATITGDASMILMSIPGAHLTTNPQVSGRVSGTTAAADPPSLSPSWGAEDNLFISIIGSGLTSGTGTWTGTGTTYPANYTDGVDTNASDTSTVGDCEAGVSFRQLNAASEDVGTAGVDISNARNAAVVIAVRPAPPVMDLRAHSWRWRNDDGSETGATWKAAQNTNPSTQAIDEPFRLRFRCGDIGGASGTFTAPRLEYQFESSGWNVVDGTVNVGLPGSTHFTDGAATTEQLTGGDGGAFVAGTMDENGAVANVSIGADGNTEIEWCVALLSDLTVGWEIEFRVTANGTVLPETNGHPTTTVAEAPSTNLVIQNSQQAQTTQAVVLSPHLVIQNSQQAQVAQNVVLTVPAVDLVINNSQQAQVTDQIYSHWIVQQQDAGNNTAQIQFTVDAEVGDKILLLHADNFYTVDNLNTPGGTAVSTWELKHTLDGGTNDNHCKVWTGTVTTADGTVVTSSDNTDHERYASVWVLRGMVVTPEFDTVASTDADTTSTSHVAPSVTPTSGKIDDLLFCLFGTLADGPINYTMPGGMTAYTERDVDIYNTYRAASERLTSDSASGTRTATASAAREWFAVSVLTKSGTVAANLVIQNSQQAQTTQAVTLVPNLVIQNSQQTQTTQAVTLSPVLVIQNSQQAQTTQAVTLVPNLVIQNSQQAQTTQAVVLSPHLIIQNSQQAQTSDNITLTAGGVQLVIQNSQQAQATQSVTLSPVLVIQNSQQAQTTQSVTLVPNLVIQSSQQAQTTQSVTLSPVLAIQNSQQAQTTQSVTLSPVLAIQNSQQAQTTQTVTLAPHLVIQNSQQAQVAQNVTLAVAGDLIIQDNLQVQVAQNVILTFQEAFYQGWGILLAGSE